MDIRDRLRLEKMTEKRLAKIEKLSSIEINTPQDIPYDKYVDGLELALACAEETIMKLRNEIAQLKDRDAIKVKFPRFTDVPF